MERALSIDELLAHTSWVRDLARTMVVDPATAEDLAQETLLVALRRPPRADVPVRAWLAGVLRRLTASWRRRETRRAAREALVEPEREVVSTEELVSQVEVERRLAKEVLALPEPFRRTVLLRYFRGLSSAEIARRTGAPEGTVRWRLKRGLDQLRASMDEGYGERDAWVIAILPGLRALSRGLGSAGIGGTAASIWALLLGALRIAALPLAAFAALLVSALALGLFSTRGRGSDALALAPRVGDVAPGTPGSAPLGGADERVEATARALGGAPVPATREGFELRARALDEFGAALADARLELASGGRIFAATSGGDGEIALALPLPVDADDAPLELELSAPERVTERVAARRRGARIVWLGDLELARAAALEGRVLEAEGEPALGAEVLLETLPEAPEMRERTLVMRSYLGSQLADDAPRTRTGADGRYRFDALAAGFVRVWARADYGFASASEPLVLEAGRCTTCADLALPALRAEACIEGRVVDPSGAPVAGACVEAIRGELEERLFRGDSFAFRARSDVHGRFRLGVNPRPELLLSARDPNGAWADARTVRAVGGASGIELALRERRFVELRASDGEQRPISAFEAALHRASDGLRLAGPLASEPERRALRFEPPDADFVVRVRAPGFDALELGPFERDETPARIDCALEEARPIQGRVTHGGAAVAGARLVAARLVAPTGGWRAVEGIAKGARPFGCALGALEAECTSDGEGRFVLRGAPPVRFLLAIEAAGFGASLHGPFEARELFEGRELALELESAGALEGRVLTGERRSAAGVLVGATNGDGRLRVARSDGEGAFRFDELAPGSWQVRELAHESTRSEEEHALLAGGEARAGTPPGDALVISGTIARCVLDLRAAARTRIEGELLFDGSAPGPWRVELERADGLERAGRGERPMRFATALDVAGRFELELPSAGTYLLRAFDADRNGPIARIEDRVEIEPNGTHWRLALDTGRVALRAMPGEEVPGGRLTYRWEGPGELCFAARIDRDGKGGGLALRAPAGRGRLVAKPIEKAAWDAASLIEFELEAGASIAPLLPPLALWER